MELKIDPKEVTAAVETQIRLAIAEALGKDPTAWIKKIVDVSLAVKANSYDSRTMFQTSMAEMIRDAAKEAFKVWIDENKGKIVAAVISKIKSLDYAEKVADSLVRAFSDSANWHLSVNYPEHQD